MIKKKKHTFAKINEQTFDLPKVKAAFLPIPTSSMNLNPLPIQLENINL